MIKKPTLLNVTAAVAAVSVATSAVTGVALAAEDAPAKKAPASRLGSAIEGDLAKRDKVDAERQRKMDLQQQALQASQKRLDAGLEQAQGEDQGDEPKDSKKDRAGNSVADETADHLARIYQSMKAKKAAPVFEKLDLDLQIAVARKMRERNAANILAEMSPNAAAKLSMALAGRKVVPAKP